MKRRGFLALIGLAPVAAAAAPAVVPGKPAAASFVALQHLRGYTEAEKSIVLMNALFSAEIRTLGGSEREAEQLGALIASWRVTRDYDADYLAGAFQGHPETVLLPGDEP